MNLMLRRREMMTKSGGGGGDLPAGYRSLPYIVGHQSFLNTGLTYRAGIKIAFKERLITPSSYGCLFGSNGSSELLLSFRGNTRNFLGGLAWDHTYTVGQMYEFEIDLKYTSATEQKVYIDGDLKYTATNRSIDAKTIFLGAMNNSNDAPGFPNNEQEWYYFDVYDTNGLVASLKPCVRVADNVVGMYDIIRNQFLSSANSNPFTT